MRPRKIDMELIWKPFLLGPISKRAMRPLALRYLSQGRYMLRESESFAEEQATRPFSNAKFHHGGQRVVLSEMAATNMLYAAGG